MTLEIEAPVTPPPCTSAKLLAVTPSTAAANSIVQITSFRFVGFGCARVKDKTVVGGATHVPSRTSTLLAPWLAIAKSCTPSPLKSPNARSSGKFPPLSRVPEPKSTIPGSPALIKNLVVFVFSSAVAKSCFPSRLKSPITTVCG